MEKMLHKTLRSMIALLLVFTMLVGAGSNVIAASVNDLGNEDTINYVSIGASQTNGYGMRYYLPDYVYDNPLLALTMKDSLNVYGYKRHPEKAYPYLVKTALEESGKTVNLEQLAISSMRAEEVRMLLDDEYMGDKYTEWRFYNQDGNGWFKDAEEGGLPELRAAYQKAVTEADLISLDIGVNNFGVYMMNQIVSGGTKYGSDLTKVFTEEELAKYYTVKEDVTKLVAEKIGTDEAAILTQFDFVIDSAAYALAGFMISFDKVVEKIYEFNPDANIVVLGLQNMIYGVDATMEGVVDGEFPLGDIFGAVVNMANLYTASLSPYADRYYYGYPGEDGHIDTFLDDIRAYDGNPYHLDYDMRDCFDVYDNNINIRPIIQLIFAKAASDMVNKVLTGLAQLGLYEVPVEAKPNAEEANEEAIKIDPSVIEAVLAGKNPAKILESMGEGAKEYFNEFNELLAFFKTNENNGWDQYLVKFEEAYGTLKEENPDGYQELAVQVQTAVAAGKYLCAAYEKALYAAYDVFATIMKTGAEQELIDITALFSDAYGKAEKKAMEMILVDSLTSVEAVLTSAKEVYLGAHSVNPDDIVVPDYQFNEALLEDSAFVSVLCMGVRTGFGNSFYAHPNKTGHEQLKDAIITAYEEEIRGKKVTNEEIAEELVKLGGLIAEYYDEAYAYAYDYAEDNGYIDILTEGLDTADKALADINVDAIPLSEEFTAEFKEKLKESISNARGTIAQAKKLILEADELDKASLDELMALLDEAFVNVTDIAKLLEIAAVDTYNDVMDIVIDTLIKLRDQAEKQLTIAIQKGTEWLMDKVQEAYDEFLKTLAEAIPVADQYLYDWIFNNPDKVCGFFCEYGDVMGKFLAEQGETIVKVLAYLGYTFGDEVLEFVMDNPETVLKTIVNWYETYGERTWAMIDRYADYLGLYNYLEEVKGQLEDAYAKAEEEVKEEIAKAIAEIEAKLTEIKGLIEEAIKESAEEAEKVILEKLEELGTAIEELVAKIEAVLEEAVSAEYIPTADSKYVAIGDSSVTGKGAKETVVPYAERLAEELGLAKSQYVNLGLDGATTADLFKVVEDNAAEFKDADLITVGLSVNAMLVEALNAAKADALPEYDWDKYLPEEAVRYIDEKLAELEAELAANEAMAEYAPMMASVVEGLGYYYVEFAFEYPELVNRIHELAAEDAQVIMVGMYNPMEGFEFADINLGEYVEYITRFANIHLTAYSLITPDTVYVSAPDVDTFAEHTEYKNDYLFLLNLVNGTHFKAQFATGEGHEYIKEQILDRMDIIRLWGDVNKDGKVNSKDAVAILRYLIRLVDASELDLTVGDLNADGKVSSKDAVLILQYCIKLITKFPVEA